MTRFLITETCEYLIEADTREQAEERWLEDEGQATFVGVVERMVQPADMPGDREADLPGENEAVREMRNEVWPEDLAR